MSQTARRLILFGGPALTGVVNLFHPTFNTPPHIGLQGRADWFITLHIINLFLFGLLGLAAFLLVEPQRGFAAFLSRLALLVFVPVYIGFDALVGIGTGSLARYAQGVAASQVPILQPAIDVIWLGPTSNALGIVGSVAWLVAMLAAAVAVTTPPRRWLIAVLQLITAGAYAWAMAGLGYLTPLWWAALVIPPAVVFLAARLQAPPALLTLAGVFFAVAHVPPAGPLAMACFLIAAVWIEFAGDLRTPDTPRLLSRAGRDSSLRSE